MVWIAFEGSRYETIGDVVMFDIDPHSPEAVYISEDQWAALGKPNKVKVTVESADGT